MEKTVPDCDHQSLQNFISDSKWDEAGVIREIQRRVCELIGNPVHGSIHLDESGFLKDGKSSVGVKRQYCGRFGKVDNCQVGVFLGYAFMSYRTLIDKRIYLPEEWANDPDRRALCSVPEEITFKTKAELGWEMLLNARTGNLPFRWVGMDCFYGQQPWFLDKLDGENFLYIADIPIERKELWCDMACLRVHQVRDGLPGPESWLIIRKDDNGEIKYQLSNASPNATKNRLAEMSCSRYWIERAFEDGKGEVGMADYEVRGWTGWHHHMTMVLLAMLFLLILQLKWKEIKHRC